MVNNGKYSVNIHVFLYHWKKKMGAVTVQLHHVHLSIKIIYSIYQITMVNVGITNTTANI